MTSLQQFLDKHFMSVKDITGYLMWNVVNTFMICFEPLFKLIPFYNNLDNVKLIINKNSKINIGAFLKEIIKYLIMLTLIYFLNGHNK